MAEKMRVLVVDDSTIFRKIVRDALANIENVEVVGHAENGAVALRRIVELKPDLVTLDLEMPEISGINVLMEIKNKGLDLQSLIISGCTSQGTRLTTQALQLGALDFIQKPSGDSLADNVSLLRKELESRIRLLQQMRACRASVQDDRSAKSKDRMKELNTQGCNPGRRQTPRVCGIPKIVVIGTSTGGPAALTKILADLPADLAAPVLIVQHMPPMFTKTLANDLNRICPLEVREAQGGEKISAGQCFLAPGGKQMKVVKSSLGVFLRVTDDLPVNHCRPSVDYLFRSVGQAYGPGVLAVIMTGMGNDGAQSIREMHPEGVHVIAQDQASCTVFGMPRCVIEDGNADIVCPLEDIAGNITRLINRKAALSCV